MASTTASIDVKVTGLASLDRLSTGIDTMQKRMLGLRSTLAGLGFAALGKSALTMADDLQDLSNASGIATGNLLEFKKALETSGGQADSMSTAIIKFSQSVDEAAQGSQKAIFGFQELGVTLNDLRSLSERDILIKTLQGISALPTASERAAAMMDKFGKSFRTVDPGEMAKKLQESAGSMTQYADSVRRAADLQDQLATATGTLKLAFLEAFSPVITLLVDFNKGVEEGRNSMETLVTVIKALGVALAVAFAFTGFGLIVRAIGTIGRGVAGLVTLFGQSGTAIAGVFRASGPVMNALRGVGGAIAAITAGVLTVMGLSGGGGGTAKASAGTEAEKKAQAELAEKEKTRREINLSAQQAAIRGIREVTTEYQKQFQTSQARSRLESELIGKSEEEKQLQLGLFDIGQKYNDLQQGLLKRKQDLKREDAYLIPIIDEQIKKNSDLYYVQVQGLQDVISAQMVAMANEKDRQNIIEAINKQIERQVALGDILQQANDKMTDVKFEAGTRGLGPLQKQMAVIAEETRKASLAAGRTFAAQFEGMDLTAQQAQELSAGLAEIATRYNQIGAAQVANLEQSRTWAEGWKTAFAEYADAAMNSAAQAQSIFAKATSSMEDAIVNFAKTGKFEFKSLVNTIVEELLRSQIRQLLASTFSAGGGTGSNFFSSLFSGDLFRANGGPVAAGTSYIVGEKGPEVFTAGSAGMITPNSALGSGGGGAVNITYNINAVDASSFRSLVASDPEFIFSVTEQGRRRQPGQRR